MTSSFSLLSALLASLLPTGDEPLPHWYQPAADVTWQIQLQGPANTGYPVDLYILDLFDTPREVINDLHDSGHRVICYFSAGSYENWRSDAARFQASDKGRPLANWPGERWLDIRSENVRRIMVERLDLAADKHCDGVDPDNVDGYSNRTGLPLTGDDQLDYNRFLADQAHRRGLAVSLKNNLDQVEALVDYVDFAVNESCHQWQECQRLQPFVDAGKPVLHIDYQYGDQPQGRANHCQHMNNLGFLGLSLPRALDDSFRFSCRP